MLKRVACSFKTVQFRSILSDHFYEVTFMYIRETYKRGLTMDVEISISCPQHF